MGVCRLSVCFVRMLEAGVSLTMKYTVQWQAHTVSFLGLSGCASPGDQVHALWVTCQFHSCTNVKGGSQETSRRMFREQYMVFNTSSTPQCQLRHRKLRLSKDMNPNLESSRRWKLPCRAQKERGQKLKRKHPRHISRF